MTELLLIVAYISLGIHTVLLSYAIWRVWNGENPIDRLLASELVGTLVLSVLVLITLIERSNLFLDVALGLAALSFIGIIAFARYAADRRMF
ncbi:MAG: monovalent cation/H+ antiporter complex subunit F [Anaerolineae bacterium]|nr:monovalent cation/H+ antiporter complex subunit F [Anaerolineae bacterium]MCO5190702.1 monovalent cation/H+ antiporter complex subunit F [Anaerolineae bacterium]